MPSSTRQCRACACDVRSRAPRELCRTLWRTPDAMPYATCIAARRRPVRLLRCAYRKRHAIRNDRQRVGRRTTRVSTSPARTPAAKLTPSAFATTMREPPPPPPSDIRSVCSASVTRYSPLRSAAPGLRATQPVPFGASGTHGQRCGCDAAPRHVSLEPQRDGPICCDDRRLCVRVRRRLRASSLKAQ